jgi:hypothetical protein
MWCVMGINLIEAPSYDTQGGGRWKGCASAYNNGTIS